jgi:hypothetical protein
LTTLRIVSSGLLDRIVLEVLVAAVAVDDERHSG